MDTVINGREAKEQRRMERLVVLLEDWAQWMRRDRSGEGYPGHSAVIGGAGLKSFEDMCFRVDATTNRTIDACINDLTPAQTAAINRRYLDAVWRFPRENYSYALCLQEAHENLLRKVQKKGVWLGD